MKYKNIWISPYSDFVETTRVCSHCGSGEALNGDENFCPRCGAKLTHIPNHLNKDAITGLINENIDKLPKPPKMEPKANLNDHCSTTGGTEDHDGWTVTSNEKETTECPYGKGTPETCGHCTCKGACNFTILPSLPSQYKMCPFRGSGYIFCKDA